MDIRKTFLDWPVVRQLTGKDPLGRGAAVQSAHTRQLTPRTSTADRVVQSVCPYCAVGCGQKVFVKDDHVVQIEGDPDSPVSRGRLCPKGSASEQLVNSPGRATTMLYRRARAAPSGSGSGSRRRPTWSSTGCSRRGPGAGRTTTSTAARSAGRWGSRRSAAPTLDNEENYLIKKLFTALGAIQIENQARI